MDPWTASTSPMHSQHSIYEQLASSFPLSKQVNLSFSRIACTIMRIESILQKRRICITMFCIEFSITCSELRMHYLAVHRLIAFYY